MAGFLRATWLIARKDLRIELRTKEVVITVGLFALLVVVLSSLAFYQNPVAAMKIAPGVMWITIAFAGGFMSGYICSKGDPFWTLSGGLAGVIAVSSGADVYAPSLTYLLAFAGAAFVVILVLAVAVWMALQRPQSESAADMERFSRLTASFGNPSGFRSDVWFLPDEELLGFVEVPAGPFLMGSNPAIDPLAFDNEWWPGAHSQVRVDLPVFYVGRYEVTVAQFAAFVDAAGFSVGEQTFQGPPNHPVSAVSWPDALEDPRVEQLLRERIDRQLENLSPYEQVGKFALLVEPFSLEREEMTAKLSLRRDVIMKNQAAVIEAMYEG